MSKQQGGPIAITMGCPVGIGSEIICRFFTGNYPDQERFVVFGDRGVLQRTAEQMGLSVCFCDWTPGQRVVAPDYIPVMGLSNLDQTTLQWGGPTRETGLAMASYITQATALCMEGKCSALVTCPISKKTLNEAGYYYPGHTEMLADLTAASRYRMMMHGSRLNVVLVTIHEPLSKVPELLSSETIFDCIAMTYASLQRDFGITDPRIAVSGFNPHAGEEGMFGKEEKEIIIPALSKCEEKWQISGPWPPDTVFHKAATGAFDAVIAMYHDQGLIPFKLLHFSDGVNVTLGLPIVRTSVDHGTAYDIAGKGIADERSLATACHTAQIIVENRRRYKEI